MQGKLRPQPLGKEEVFLGGFHPLSCPPACPKSLCSQPNCASYHQRGDGGGDEYFKQGQAALPHCSSPASVLRVYCPPGQATVRDSSLPWGVFWLSACQRQLERPDSVPALSIVPSLY